MVNKQYLFKNSVFLSLLSLILTFGLLPVGLNNLGILTCYLFFIIICFRFVISYKLSFVLIFFLTYFSVQIMTNIFLERDIDIVQVLRTSVHFFLGFIVYILVLDNKKITFYFFKYELYILVYISILFFLYFFLDVRLYSSSLIIEDSDRFYIFSPMLFFPLFVLAVKKGNLNSVFYLFFLGLTLQKTIMLSIIVVYILHFFFQKNDNKKFGYKNILVGITAFLLVVTLVFMIVPRFLTFLEVGDTWRLIEISKVFEIVSNDMIKLLFGNGIGIPYREFVEGVDLDSRLAVNMRYDVHNFYADIILKLGLFFLICLLIVMYQLMRPLGSLVKFQIFSFYIIQGLSSPVLFQSIDFLGFMLGLSLITNVLKNNCKDIA